jgi:hypothetical protein
MTQASGKKNYLLIGAVILLAVSAGMQWSLRGRLSALVKASLKQRALLAQALPNFTERSAVLLAKEVLTRKEQLAGSISLFDPKDAWLKKDYDLSIYFVEELSKANQALASEALAKGISFPELGFKEKLPQEEEAAILLSQLFGIKRVAQLGIEQGMRFKSIIPLGADPVPGLSAIRAAATRIELTAPSQSLIEFIIQLQEVIPKACVVSLSVKSAGQFFDIDLSLANIIVDMSSEQLQMLAAFPKPKAVSLDAHQQVFARALRSSNPFFVPPPVEVLAVEGDSAKQQQLKPARRYIYNGTAVLRAKSVVIIEDTLRNETLFVGKDEKLGDFIVDSFDSESAALRNSLDHKELILKRGES